MPDDRPLILGQMPGRTTDPRRPLSGRSGAMLARLGGLDGYEELADTFQILNAWPFYERDGFPRQLARQRLGRLCGSILREDRLVMVLGGETMRVFFPIVRSWSWLVPEWRTANVHIPNHERAGTMLILPFPHPSNLNRWWNEPANGARAQDVLRAWVDVSHERRARRTPALP